MMRIASTLTVAVSVVALAFTSSAGAGAASNKLVGAVGKNGSFKITLVNSRGRVVRSLPAGTYTIAAHDYSRIHNFVLEREHGPEREVTDVGDVGAKTIRVKLTRGLWKVYCEPHESTMVQHFSVR